MVQKDYKTIYKTLYETLYKTLYEHAMLDECRNLIIGISGGADSVCLLLTLNEIINSKFPDINIIAAHVNHMLRGEEADMDENYVRELCMRRSLPFRIKRIKVADIAAERGISIEMAGRDTRYGFFNELASGLEKCKIAVAHNREDRAETVFLNILRGTGITGLKGIPYIRGNVIRPLLDVSKEDIRGFCEQAGEKIREDKSNFTTDYTRNKVRLELIPFINRKFNVDITDKIIRLSDNAGVDDRFLDICAKEAAGKCVEYSEKEIKLKLNEFTALHLAVKSRILQIICEGRLENIHYDKLLNFLETAASGKTFDLPGGFVAAKEYNNVIFCRKEYAKKRLCFEYPAEGTIKIDELKAEIICKIYDFYENNGKFENSSLKQVFDYDKINGNAVIRNRREGDFFKPYKGSGTRKLKNYFIDNKIPLGERDKKILLAKENEIIWIAGIRLGNNYLPDDSTKRFLYVEIKMLKDN